MSSVYGYLITSKASIENDWWKNLSSDEQDAYLKDHPHSHLKKTASASLDKKGLSKHAESGKWHDSDGNEASEEHHARIKKLGIPPAWKDLKLSVDPSAALQATGKDAKGRTQYLYSIEHSEKAAAEKFDRLKKFTQVVPKIVSKSKKDAAAGNDSAAALLLIANTGFRVGSDSDTKAEEKAFGASNLTAEHAEVASNKKSVTFNFTGKKGVKISKRVTDPHVVKMLLPRIEKGGRLFNTDDGRIRDYLHSLTSGFKVKDFRTYNGTSLAHQTVADMPEPTTKKEFLKAQLDVCKIVAAHLGNTPKICKEAYIDPAIWGKWEANFMEKPSN